MAEARRAWAEAVPELDPDRLVFPDETWATTAMARARGRAPRGERLVCPVPHGRWRTTTFLCGLRAEGLVAPLVLDGAIDGPAFLAWVERALAPTLSPGDTVVADNLGSHKVAGVREAIEARGKVAGVREAIEARGKVAGVREAIEARGASLLYLPSYSPDLNPIELAFSKLKRLLRAAAARTADALCSAIGAALGQFTAAECANHIRHCGYAQSGR